MTASVCTQSFTECVLLPPPGETEKSDVEQSQTLDAQCQPDARRDERHRVCVALERCADRGVCGVCHCQRSVRTRNAREKQKAKSSHKCKDTLLKVIHRQSCVDTAHFSLGVGCHDVRTRRTRRTPFVLLRILYPVGSHAISIRYSNHPCPRPSYHGLTAVGARGQSL